MLVMRTLLSCGVLGSVVHGYRRAGVRRNARRSREQNLAVFDSSMPTGGNPTSLRLRLWKPTEMHRAIGPLREDQLVAIGAVERGKPFTRRGYQVPGRFGAIA